MWYFVGAAAALVVGVVTAGLYLRDEPEVIVEDIAMATLIIIVGAVIWPVVLPAAVIFAVTWLIAGRPH